MALKCADIGHLAAKPEVHKRWALLLEEEFFLQVHTLHQLSQVILQACGCLIATSCPCCHHTQAARVGLVVADQALWKRLTDTLVQTALRVCCLNQKEMEKVLKLHKYLILTEFQLILAPCIEVLVPGQLCSSRLTQLAWFGCIQGDKEKQLGMAVSPLMDRKNKGGITRSQVRQTLCSCCTFACLRGLCAPCFIQCMKVLPELLP